MSKIRLTFEVDTVKLFDTINKMQGDGSLLGNRIVACMLTGEVSTFDAIGMGLYGVELIAEKPNE
jgi:hypothetical protein